MNKPLLSLLASIALAFALLLPSGAVAAQVPPVANPAMTPVALQTNEVPVASWEALQPGVLLNQDELAALAALEAEHAELLQQQAGFFGPRIGTILIIALLVVILL